MVHLPIRLPSRLGPKRVVALLAICALMAGCSSSRNADDTATSVVDTAGAVVDQSEDEAASYYEGEYAEAEGADDNGLAIAYRENATAADEIAYDDDSTTDRAATTGSVANHAGQIRDLGRDIVYTASLDIASTDVSNTTGKAIRAMQSLGGYLYSQDTRGGSGGSSVLVFKILPEHFHDALTKLGSLGSVRSQSISANDLTEVIVDLESRITTAAASVARLRDLLADAGDIEIIASLENQLLQRETTLERLRGQLRNTRGQVDLATITVFVSELLNQPAMVLQVSGHAGHDAGFSCFDQSRLRTVDTGTAVTICYRITNVGDTPLIDLRLDDPVLNARLGDLLVVEGTITQVEPGETIVLAHEIETDTSLRLRTAIAATAIDADGNPLAEQVTATAPRFVVDVLAEDGLPGFGDVLRGSWNAVKTIAIVAALVLVAIAPFLALALILVPLLFWVWRRLPVRSNNEPTRSTESTRSPKPPVARSDQPDARTSEEQPTVGMKTSDL